MVDRKRAALPKATSPSAILMPTPSYVSRPETVKGGKYIHSSRGWFVFAGAPPKGSATVPRRETEVTVVKVV
jgi:hypothetical protein